MTKTQIGALSVAVAVLGYGYWQNSLYQRSESIVDFLIQAAEVCKSGNRAMCAIMPATHRNLNENLKYLLRPLADEVGSEGRYAKMLQAIKETSQASAEELAKSKAEGEALQRMKASFAESRKKSAESQKIAGEKFNTEYEQYAGPKIMYSCGEQVAYSISKGLSNYNALYEKAKSECPADLEFKIIKSEK